MKVKNMFVGLKGFLDVLATFAVIGVCLIIGHSVWSRDSAQRAAVMAAPSRPTAPKIPTEPLSLAGAATRGAKTAQVAIIEYSDFECPFCVKFQSQILPAILTKYVDTGQVLLAFRHLPLERLHPSAFAAAEAADCANQQGRFWEMHDALFAAPKEMDKSKLLERGAAIHLDARHFENCLDGQAAARVRADMASAQDLGISRTPTFFLGSIGAGQNVTVKERLSGAQPIEKFSQVLDRLLKGSVQGATQ